MLGLTHLGIIHTLLSLVAVAAGAAAFVRFGSISLRTRTGVVYVLATVLTCVTGFGIFKTGAFGPAHAVGVLTLVVLTFAVLVEKRTVLGSLSLALETVSYTTTYFLHMIPAVNETTTRLPPSAPLAAGPNDPLVLGLVGLAFALYVIGAAFQLLRLKSIAAAVRAS
ncbi:MAG TPA: hypothetical protein VM692_09660 [Gammaproteobacteria bacterium]|nr:hypothetical protein [Gammaproteobacteria bacterium]